VTFNAGQSSDPTGDVLQYRWDFDGDGVWDTDYLYEPTITHTYANDPGPSPWLEVFDGSSRVVEKVSLTVRNVAPSLDVTNFMVLGSDNRLSGDFTFVDPGLDSWRVDVSYGDGTPRMTVPLVGQTFTLNHQFPPSGYFQVDIDIRDDGALTRTQFRVITGAPTVLLQRTGSSTVQVSWPNHPAPFRLESSALLPGGAWEPVTATPVLTEGRRQVLRDSTNAHEYFRLVLP
jgi:hypothetical protein